MRGSTFFSLLALASLVWTGCSKPESQMELSSAEEAGEHMVLPPATEAHDGGWAAGDVAEDEAFSVDDDGDTDSSASTTLSDAVRPGSPARSSSSTGLRRTVKESKAVRPTPSAETTAEGTAIRDASPPRTKRSDDRMPAARRSTQSGLLTAGSFDDIENFSDYQQFLNKTMQNDPHESFPRFVVGDRVLISVQTEDGKPIGEARVVIHPSQHGDSARAPLLDLKTSSRGRVTFLTARDGAHSSGEFQVEVYPPDQSDPIVRTMRTDQQPWVVSVPGASMRLPAQLDLALVIDTTGSMADELEYLKVEIDSIASAVARMFPNVSQRYSLIVYRDTGDQYVSRAIDFTDSLSEFQQVLAEQHADGGGDYPEAMHLALRHATQLSWRDRDTARVLFLLGDAPPHDQLAGEALSHVDTLRRQGVRVFPIAASGAAWKAEFVMRAAAFLTQGQYLFLTDHSGVGNPHAKPHVPKYQVERLDRLMIRMIASQLAGKNLVPQEVIAIESGETDPGQLIYPGQQRQAQTLPASHAFPSSTPPRTSLRLPPWLWFAAVVTGLFVSDAVGDRRRCEREAG